MQLNKLFDAVTWFLIPIWPLWSYLVLWVSVLSSPKQSFSSDYDEAFYIKLLLILISHLIAFAVIPLILVFSRINKAKLITATIFGVIVFFFQIFARSFGNFSLQPRDDSVMPEDLHRTATIVTAAMLSIVLVSAVYLMAKKLNQRKRF